MSEEDLRTRFKALNPKDREAILSRHNDINVDHDWWDFLEDQFKEDMKTAGFEVANIYFSGFYSQGDGASFTGRIIDWPLFIKSHELEDDFPMFLELLTPSIGALQHLDVTSRFEVVQRGYYSHEMTMQYEGEFSAYSALVREAAPVEHDLCRLYEEEVSNRAGEFLDACLDKCREHAHELYSWLQDDYEDLTSEEQILESLIANEMLEEELDQLEETQ